MSAFLKRASRTGRHLLPAVPFAFASTYIAFVALALTYPPPPPIAVLRWVSVLLLLLVVAFAVLVRFGWAPRVAGAALAIAAGVIALFPVAEAAAVRLLGTNGRLVGALACTGIAVVAAAWILYRRPRKTALLYPLLYIVAMVVAVLMLWDIAPVLTRRPAERLHASNDWLAHVDTSAQHPDVYHIIFDGLGRPDVLQERYGTDLSLLVQELRRRGFTTDPNVGVGNYVQTSLSVASMLNGTYVNSLIDSSETSRRPLSDLIQGSVVIDAFKRLNYQFHYFGSVYLLTRTHERANTCDCDLPFIAEFEGLALRMTPLAVSGLAGLDHQGHRKKILQTLDRIESLGPASSPRYVLAHILAPHPPFVFDADGSDTSPQRIFSINDGNYFPGTAEEYERGYRRQAQYVATRMLRLVDAIDRQASAHDRGVVVIIHGDHGPRLHWDQDDPRGTDPSESLPLFLAIRWTGGSRDDDGPRTLVNVYRSLFRRYFDPDIQLLPDRAFVSSYRRPYELLEVELQTLHEPGGGKQPTSRD